MKLGTIVLIRHRVANVRKWKSVFEADGHNRKAHGCKAVHLFRDVDHAKELVIILRWNDPVKARHFAESDELRELMAKGGVSDLPDVYVLEEFDTTAQ
jgi:heme-degrading monooxygenase HmoA